MGRKSAAHHARRELEAHNEFVAEFEDLATGLDAFLDRGDFDAFANALYVIEDRYDGELRPVDPDAPRGERLAEQARRFAKASLARSFMLTLQGRTEDRMEHAKAQLIAIAAEPVDMPQYGHRLCNSIIAEGIRQEDVGHGSRALGRRLAAAILASNAGASTPGDETFGDTPLHSWADLPREFAGYRLVDVPATADRLVMKPFVCPLPPSTDIAYYTVDSVAPPLGFNRRKTYDSWMPVIEDWAKRTNRELHDQQPPIWAMLLAHRLSDDNSKVDFFNNMLIESPWDRGRVVMVEVVEDDVPEFPR